MPVNVELSENKRYIIYNIIEPLVMEELLDAYKQEKVYRDSIPHVMHSIVDMSQIRKIPREWLTAKSGPGLTHPRSGTMLFVGISPGLNILIRTITKFMRYDRMQFFDTREEAEAYMQELIAEGEIKKEEGNL
ncbi:MAG: hypothetical protein K8L99_04310 [Anaerolineae bacterium]|nr:hypothetical protein [Anaerolineae bacterium]